MQDFLKHIIQTVHEFRQRDPEAIKQELLQSLDHRFGEAFPEVSKERMYELYNHARDTVARLASKTLAAGLFGDGPSNFSFGKIAIPVLKQCSDVVKTTDEGIIIGVLCGEMLDETLNQLKRMPFINEMKK